MKLAIGTDSEWGGAYPRRTTAMRSQSPPMGGANAEMFRDAWLKA